MIVLPRSARIVAFTKPVTFQMHVDGLAWLVRSVLREDPLSGDLFCFFNNEHTRVRILVWDRNGFWLLSKRLERGAFQRLDRRKPAVELSREKFVMLLEGVDLDSSRSRRNFSRDVRMSARDDGDRPARPAR